MTPAAVGLVTSLGGWVRHASVRRWAEATALAICLAVTGWLAFGVPFGRVTGLPISIDTPLVVQLPLVVWAAFRFGPVAVSLVLLAMTFLATWTVVSGEAVSPPLSPERLIFTVQMFLIGVGVTLLGLAALTEERRLSIHAVRERLRFEGLMLEFSRAFVRIPSEQVDRVSAEWLGRIGSFLRLDGVRLFQVVTGDLTLVAEWKRPGQGPTPPIDVKEDFPWILTRIQANSAVVLPNLDTLPPDAARDRASLKAQGYNAVLMMPMLADEQLVGGLAFGTVAERAWADELVVNLRLMSEVLANALVRRHTDDALRSSEVMKSAILDSLTSGVAVIDAHGRILGLNGNWTRLVEQSGVMSHSPVLLGDDLLIASSPDAVAGIKAVLNGSQTRSALEWASSTTADTRWWMLVTTRLNRVEGGAVVTLIEITERRRAEIEAQRSRQVLAHVGRVSTMGELTASLAHQLNQPLTGILSNAQAARRLLEMLPPDYAEVRGAMSDIVDDARRASEVIQHLRDLMRRGEFEMSPVDVNAVIRDVVGLVGSDAVIRNVTVTLDLDPQPIVVRGNSVQLQQVVLNLIVNALEAITDGDGERAVCVSCRRAGPHEVRVVVRDSGTGLDEGEESLVFDPFYTTKAHGMGMGLSIARSIVESHGGSIHAGHQDRGTAFEFSLPLSESAELV